MKNIVKVPTLVIATSFITACGNSSSDPDICDSCTVVIAGVASTFDSSEVNLATSSAPYEIFQGYGAQDLSDIRVAGFGEHFYRIGRSNQDNITKYRFDDPNNVVWQFSTGVDSNPYDIIFVSEDKAYVLRYGGSSVWIVDPQC